MKLFNEILESELDAWAVELAFYENFLKRGVMDQDKREKIFLASYCCYAIIRELEELKEMLPVEHEKMKIRNSIYKIYPRKFEENGVISYGFFTYLSLPVEGEENLGPQIKSIKIYFNKDNIDSQKFKNGGTILVSNEKHKRPWIYKKSENGKWPYIWIDEVIDFIEEPKGSEENV